MGGARQSKVRPKAESTATSAAPSKAAPKPKSAVGAAGKASSRSASQSSPRSASPSSPRAASTSSPRAEAQASLGSSPWSGFYRLPPQERLSRIAKAARLSPKDANILAGGYLDAQLGSRLVENHVGAFPIPLGIAVGFVVDGQSVIVPMAVEESSVIAAASHSAKLVAEHGVDAAGRTGGGFATHVDDPIMIGQVELRGLRAGNGPTGMAAARRIVRMHARAWRDWLNEQIPSMVHRGGGVRAVEAHPVGKDRLVLHILVDCRDAMGANLVNTLCEALAPRALQAMDEAGVPCRIGLRILSNLSTHRVARAQLRVPVAAVGGAAVAKAIVEANQFAILDPYRAATHNKGILNGIDPVVIATGNDWRAVEAGAHAYAARGGTGYRALTTYTVTKGQLVGTLELPLAVGTVGGVTRLHPVADVCMKLLGNPDSRRLAAILASVGLAQNLSALKALSTTGIQAGHMALHAQNLALQAGLVGDAADRAARTMVKEGKVTASRARELAGPQA